MATDLCRRCRHPAEWHRHDDTAHPNENGHNSHGTEDHDNRLCPCRCIGYDCTGDGPVPSDSQACGCPAYVEPPVVGEGNDAR